MKNKQVFILIIAFITLLVDLFASLYFLRGLTPQKILGLEKEQKMVSVYSFQKKQWWNDPLTLEKIREPDTILISGLANSVQERLITIKTENGDTKEIIPSQKMRIYKYSPDVSVGLSTDPKMINVGSPVVVNYVNENNLLIAVSLWIE